MRLYLLKNLVLSALFFAISAVVLFVLGVIPVHAQSATDDITVSLTVGTSSTSTDDQEDDEEEDREEIGGGQPTRPPELQLSVGSVDVGQEYAEITWETTLPARSQVHWQQISGAEDSFVQASDDNYGRSHTTRISGLQSGTRYEITLTAETRNGDTTQRREVVQTDLPDGPESVSGLRASLTGDGSVRLAWANPPGRHEYVRVTRTSDFFSDQPLRGRLVYEGADRQVLDRTVEPGQTYFYSVFTRAENGQWSAPALAAVYVPAVDAGPDDQPVGEIIEGQPEAPAETRNLLRDLTFSDLIFSQGRLLVDGQNASVTLEEERTFSVGLEYDLLPEVLKTVVVTITDPDQPEKTFSFLLRADQTQDFYKATIAGLQEVGSYQTEAAILDYRNRRVKTLNGQITIEPGPNQSATTTPVINQLQEIGSRSSDTSGFALFLLFLLVIGALIIGYEHRSLQGAPKP